MLTTDNLQSLPSEPVRPNWEQRINTGARWAFRHWLLFANGLVLLYGGLPWLSPLAYVTGHPLIGRLLFMLYIPLCHQLHERSFTLFGYQVAFCHRETALYTTLFVGGLLFGCFRKRIQPARWWVAWLLTLPILLDGGSHFVSDFLVPGLRDGGDAVGTVNFWLRIITGALFAVAVVLAVYPRLDRDLRNAKV